MKKTIKLFSLLVMAGAMVFTSCKKDDETEPVDNTPVITFMGGTGYISADASLTPGATFNVGINASESPNSKKNLESFKVVRTFNNENTTVFEELNIGATDYSWEDGGLIALAVAGEERWTFTITDKDGESKELFFTITTTPTVVAYTNITMGSYNDATYGSFMDTETGTVMLATEAAADQSSVDFAFYLGAINKSTFGAPSNDDIKSVFSLTGVWTVFNETLFEMSTLSATDFDDIGASYAFPAFTGTKDDINNLEAGDVVYFKNTNDQLGFIKINSINGKGDIINIDMKVSL